MQKLTRFHFAGYLFMIIGLIVAIINCLSNYNTTTVFGNFFLYIFSGMVFAAGLLLVFREKIEVKDEQKISDNKN